MALSEEAFPPTIVNGEEFPHPATLISQTGPTQRRAELSGEMFDREHELYGAHYMTDIVTAPIDATEEHLRGTGDVPVQQLLIDTKSAKNHRLNTREQLAAKFIKAGLTTAAVGIEGRTKEIKAEMNKDIKQLKGKVKKATARKIGATVVIPE